MFLPWFVDLKPSFSYKLHNTTSPAPTGDEFCSWQFNLYVAIFLASIFSKSQERRHPVFRWLITILAPVLVVLGTMGRTIQISGCSSILSPTLESTLSQCEVDWYFKLSLMSWIACIIVDGYAILNIFIDYQTFLLKNFFTKCLIMEKSGLGVSLIYMVKLGFNVYYNFNHLTSDTSLYVYFTFCAICKVMRSLVQG